VRYFKFLFFIFFFICLINYNSYSFLKTKGKDIVDSSGQKVLLRGIGLGGWLVPEGYQLHIPGFGSPTDIRNKIVSLIGEANTEEFYRRYIANYVAEEDIALISSWGFNSIRLPFNYRMLSPENQPGVYLEEGFQIIDQVVGWCKKYNIYLILDMHCAPGGQNSGNISDSDGIEARLWTNSANQDRTVEIWKKIAERYANEKIIGGYDLINETVLPPEHFSSEMRVLFMRITNEIRKADKNHIIFIEGNWYATDFTNLTPPWDANLVYSFHHYWGENTQTAIQNYINIQNLYNVPLWLGETGENSNPWAHDCVKLMESKNIGWNWWTHKKVATLTSPYSSPISEKYQKVLDYWNGQTSKPTLEFAKDALFEMAENLVITKCDFRPGVLQALADPDFNVTPKPFKEHFIPGKIDAVDYDIGYKNVSYSDNDYENVNGPGGAVWNAGWQYRNDGVDIELCDDVIGAEYNIGWVEDTEWLLFTIQVEQSAGYRVDFRISSSNNYGQMVFYLNNIKISELITISNTGGLNNWQTQSVSDIFLQEGTHQFKVVFLKGGFNLNFFNFVSSSNEEKNSLFPVTHDVFMGQNYPNPFNKATQIPILLEAQKNLRLNIYNSQGALIKNIFSGSLSDGYKKFVWDGTNDFELPVSTGVYYFQLDINGNIESKSMLLIK
jgi:endoglucanase